MDQNLKKILIAIGIILIAVVVLIKIRDNIETKNQISGASTTNTAESGSNIKQSAPTPTSCTRTQNCGSPTCGAARGGTCGAATGGTCGGR